MQFDITFSHIAPRRTNSRVWVRAEGATLAVAALRLHPIRRLPTAVHPTNMHPFGFASLSKDGYKSKWMTFI